VLKKRLKKKNAPDERSISDDYIEEVAKAYDHFFFHYSASDLLVVNTSDIDFVDRHEDLQELLPGSPSPSRARSISCRWARRKQPARRLQEVFVPTSGPRSGSDFGAIYAQKTPDELLRLAADKGSLTDEAQRALEAKLLKRGITGDETARSVRQPAEPPAESQPFRPLGAKLKGSLLALGFFAVMIGGFVLAQFATSSSSFLGSAKWPLAVIGLALFVLARWWFSRGGSEGRS